MVVAFSRFGFAALRTVPALIVADPVFGVRRGRRDGAGRRQGRRIAQGHPERRRRLRGRLDEKLIAGGRRFPTARWKARRMRPTRSCRRRSPECSRRSVVSGERIGAPAIVGEQIVVRGQRLNIRDGGRPADRVGIRGRGRDQRCAHREQVRSPARRSG